MDIPFSKWQMAGNDFLIIDGIASPDISLDAAGVRALADRQQGMGCDQVLWLLPAEQSDTVARYRVFNADGSEAEQCGNGACALARYWQTTREIGTENFAFHCLAGTVPVFAGETLQVGLGKPVVTAKKHPSTAWAYAVNVGNPHVVLPVETLSEEGQLEKLAVELNETVNIEFVTVLERHTVKARVFERGVGETQACGSGACAIAAALVTANLCEPVVTIQFPGGDLQVDASDSSMFKLTAAASPISL